MPEQGLWLAATLALVPAWMGSRTAWALLASLAYATALETMGVPFGASYIVADAYVMRAIWQPSMNLQDELILALFPVAWLGYALDEYTRYDIAMPVVILQFLLVLPWPKLQRIIFSISHGSLRAGGGQEVTHGGRP